MSRNSLAFFTDTTKNKYKKDKEVLAKNVKYIKEKRLQYGIMTKFGVSQSGQNKKRVV